MDIDSSWWTAATLFFDFWAWIAIGWAFLEFFLAVPSSIPRPLSLKPGSMTYPSPCKTLTDLSHWSFAFYGPLHVQNSSPFKGWIVNFGIFIFSKPGSSLQSHRRSILDHACLQGEGCIAWKNSKLIFNCRHSLIWNIIAQETTKLIDNITIHPALRHRRTSVKFQRIVNMEARD